MGLDQHELWARLPPSLLSIDMTGKDRTGASDAEDDLTKWSQQEVGSPGQSLGGLQFPFKDPKAAKYLMHFIHDLSPWVDICDPKRHFATEVPKRVCQFPLLAFSLLAFSSRQLCRKTDVPDPACEAYYSQAITLLIELLNDPVQSVHENTLASIVLLRLYEEFSGTHLLGSAKILDAASSFAAQGGLGEAASWIVLRQNLYVSLANGAPIKMDLAHYRNSSAFLEADDGSIANRAVLLCSQVLACTMCSARQPTLEEWADLHDEACRCADGVLVLGYQHFYLARILLHVFDPRHWHPSLCAFSKRSTAEWQACALSDLRAFIGLAMSNPKVMTASFTAHHALHTCGCLLRNAGDDERDAVLDFLRGVASKTGWRIQKLLEKLNAEWSGKEAVVFWGSQSGTAEGFANRLARELSQRLQLPALAADLSDFDPETIASISQDKVVIFILATYGEGDPSDNASQFWDWVTKTATLSLVNLRYAAFGLGNSNYQHFNRVVDVVDSALQKAGAQRLLSVDKADDSNGGTEEDFGRWKRCLFESLAARLGITEREPGYAPVLSAVFDPSMEPIDLHLGEPAQSRASECKPRALTIKSAHELFTDTDRSCLHMDMDISKDPELVYKTGDHVGIWPINPDQEVDRLIQVLGLADDGDTPLSINALDPAMKVHIPTPTTISALFRYYLEICAPVSRELASSLAEFAPSPEVKSWILELCATRDSYSLFLGRTYVTLGRLLERAVEGTGMDWSSVPLTFVLENLPQIRPRYYSISSSSVVSPRSVSVTALVSNTPLCAGGQTVPGITTNFLLAKANAHQGVAIPLTQAPGLTYHLRGPSNTLEQAKVFAHLCRSTFKLPALASCPLIMLAAGTGIAPFRAFIAERARLQAMGRQIGDMLLFFGCRHPDQDYIYHSELEGLQAVLGRKLQIFVAYSRLHAEKRKYIQDKMGAQGDDIRRLVDNEASIYICGRASMARDAGHTLGRLIGDYRGLNEQQAKNWVASMKRTRKWQEDVWG
ncbi:alpha methylacyl- racemase protein [Purpureocillium lavendulum]|uniref:Alpha methylacyl- racemase protein n=1 Tax=Purpureocillium lavendulum TaxID=1247861 RepID=A0AB34FX58_9HYPO|nr:alpha methylacyl- racemase protein [Purpureocillium lavendulum]